MNKMASEIFRLAKQVEGGVPLRMAEKQPADEAMVTAIKKLNSSLLTLDKVVRGDAKSKWLYSKVETDVGYLLQHLATIYDLDLENL